VRLAVVVKGDAFGTGLWSLTQAGLTINGAEASDPSNPSVLSRQYDAAPTSAEMAAIAAKVQSFAPHIILSIGTGEAISGLLTPIEAGWPAAHPTQAKPQWLFTDGGQATQLLTAASDVELRTRVRGTVPGSRGPLYGAFVNHYTQVYADQPPTFGSAGAYDIVYLLAYAAAAASTATADSGPLTGARLVSGLLRAVSNDPSALRIDVGTLGLLRAFQELQAGRAIKFTGASGPLDFDVAVGEAPSDIDVWCISQNGPAVFRSSGVYYAADAGALVGTFACPRN
jgi:ABC-type branched-subunit amino acid transport system substrate-binding protein